MQFVANAQGAAQEYAKWERAALGTSQADPFCCLPAWQLAFHETFGPERRLIIEEHAGSALLFAEKIFPQQGIFLTPIEAAWFFGCPLPGKDAPAMLLDAMPFLEKNYGTHFPKIIVSGIRPDGLLAQRLMSLFRDRFDIYLHSGGVQCAASLRDGMDGYLSRRSANFRSKLKKSLRKAKEAGISFERYIPASEEEAKNVYAIMLSVEGASWKGVGRCGMAESPVREFYERMLCRLARNRAGRIILARHEGKYIGFIFGGLAGHIYRGQQFSYDEAWKDFSPGNLLQYEQLAWLCEEKCRRYDMGPLNGPRMEYKRHWTEREIPIQTWLFDRV